MFVLKLLCAGFFSAIGWWGANTYVIEPYLEPKERVEGTKE
jgi:hypothetical protein